MPGISAGLLMFRRTPRGTEVLLAHPGGPFWKNKDDGAWSIPKGEIEGGEDKLTAARREFEEETGWPPPESDEAFIELTPVKQKGGKSIHAWAFEHDADPAELRSNTFEMVWPPRSGRTRSFPEIDRAAWLDLDRARRKINPAQARLLDDLADKLNP